MLTTDDFAPMCESSEFGGFGYLGSRRNVLDNTDPECPARPELLAAVDAKVIEHANTKGWSVERLFTWANGKNGRWFGDYLFGGSGDLDADFAQALRHGLI